MTICVFKENIYKKKLYPYKVLQITRNIVQEGLNCATKHTMFLDERQEIYFSNIWGTS